MVGLVSIQNKSKPTEQFISKPMESPKLLENQTWLENPRAKRAKRWMDGWMMDGWMDGWMDRWIDRKIDR